MITAMTTTIAIIIPTILPPSSIVPVVSVAVPGAFVPDAEPVDGMAEVAEPAGSVITPGLSELSPGTPPFGISEVTDPSATSEVSAAAPSVSAEISVMINAVRTRSESTVRAFDAVPAAP